MPERIDLRTVFNFLLLIACLFMSAASGMAGAVVNQDEAKWERYIASGEEFSALFPEQPTMITIIRPSNELFGKPKRGRMYSAYGDGIVYVVMSFDNPRRKESLGVFIGELNEKPLMLAKPETFERDLSLNSFGGKQYRSGTNAVGGILQFYQMDNHVYVFAVMGEDLNKQGVNQFLTSLALKGKAAGKVIPDESQYETLPATETPAPADVPAGRNPGPQEEVLAPRAVTKKARIMTRPEPHYTEEARKNGVQGTVVLRGVFSSSGKVTRLRVISGLPQGLTQKAVSAALNLKFIPAVKDGKNVSQHIQIEYNFNLY